MLSKISKNVPISFYDEPDKVLETLNDLDADVLEESQKQNCQMSRAKFFKWLWAEYRGKKTKKIKK